MVTASQSCEDPRVTPDERLRELAIRHAAFAWLDTQRAAGRETFTQNETSHLSLAGETSRLMPTQQGIWKPGQLAADRRQTGPGPQAPSPKPSIVRRMHACVAKWRRLSPNDSAPSGGLYALVATTTYLGARGWLIARASVPGRSEPIQQRLLGDGGAADDLSRSGTPARRRWTASDRHEPMSRGQGRASRMRLVGVEAARRTCVKPASLKMPRSVRSPAWAPRAVPVAPDRELGTHSASEAW